MLPTILRRRSGEERVRFLRIATGLVLFVFVALHLFNHALVLVSLDAAEAGREAFQLIWRSWPGTILLYGSLLAHYILILHGLFNRRTLKMPFRQAAQIVLGLAIPLLLVDHVVATRFHAVTTGIDVTYPMIARILYVENPFGGAKQSIALLIAWAHGCIGMFFFLRFRKGYARIAPYLLVAAVVLPLLSLLGFVYAGRYVLTMPPPAPLPLDPDRIAAAAALRENIRLILYAAFAASLFGVMGLRLARRFGERRNMVRVRFGNGTKIDVPRGSSVLEAVRLAGIPHYAVCGGKGRCSTCRVQIVSGFGFLPPPSSAEAATLARIGAGAGVRLACQLHPIRGVTVAPLLVPDNGLSEPAGSINAAPGRETDIAVLFCDIRSFTAISESRLPYDIVFLLNRYFATVGLAVERAGGRLDKFVGDGAMALFGPAGSIAADSCRQALEAAVHIIRDLDRLSEELSGELPGPLRVAIGIHSGPAIVGRMGYGAVTTLTAIGDTVNVASRLETVAKEFDAAIVVSEDTVRLSGLDLSDFEMREVPIRGRLAPLDVRVIAQGQDLSQLLAKPTAT